MKKKPRKTPLLIMFDAVKNKLNNVKNDIYSAVYAPPTESTFFKEGKLTP